MSEEYLGFFTSMEWTHDITVAQATHEALMLLLLLLLLLWLGCYGLFESTEAIMIFIVGR